MRVMKDPLRFRRQRQFHRSRNPLAQQCAAFDFAPDSFDGDLRPRKETTSQRLVLAHQPEQQMLRLDRGSAKLRRFIASKENYAASFFSIAFEHEWLIATEKQNYRS